MNKKELISFEDNIANRFNNKEIPYPVHLDSNNEDILIDIFRSIRPIDWICCTWRSHYHCLLKGVPFDILEQKIINGQSISLCFKDYNIISSAIVGGICSIALGLALGIKLKQSNEKVYCFIGDMTAESGKFLECYKYSVNFNLPIIWIIGDNGKSVCTDTYTVWGMSQSTLDKNCSKIIRYKYNNKYPHCGSGERINF